MTPPIAPTPTAPAPHPTLFSQAFDWLWLHVFGTWPDTLVESVGAVVIVGLVALAIFLVTRLLGWFTTPLGFGVAATVASVFYEVVLDRNPAHRLRDLGKREVVIVVLTVVGALLHLLA